MQNVLPSRYIADAAPVLPSSILDRETSLPATTPRHLVLLHGLASSPKEFALLSHPLRRHGVVLHAPEIPGYSQSSLSSAARWQDWLASATGLVESITQRHGPVVIGGLCTGAVLALAIAARGEARGVRGLALLSPLLAYDGWGLPWWYRFRSLAYLLRLERRFFMEERHPYGLKNERLRQWVRQQMANGDATLAGPPRVSLQAVRESERISSHAADWLAGLAVPTLVVHAREDEICSLSSVQAAVSRAPRQLLEMTVLEDSYHMITADNDRQLVAARLAAHVAACAGTESRTPAVAAG
ncbi:alpha/beta hydrolase [Ramlibacter sp. G-1-2-2]|uniref:Alpha/beta hydrolase n=1 Tax=Ramlibacter agri TaxID=2728837 RepID=A0A848H555_9BURK|nr:alpha/beta fold hydrolase [Ramlibacter agri]NML44649.1 alpha/beta hydrolase [Ramlibacter agri]